MMEPNLTPKQELIAAYAHYILGIEQQVIAVILNVNSGRISEACKKFGSVAGLTTPGYKDRQNVGQYHLAFSPHSRLEQSYDSGDAEGTNEAH
jgi:hypothetical protein